MTDLLLRVTADPPDGDPIDRRHTDIVVSAEPDHTVGDLVATLANRLGIDAGDGRMHVVRTGTTVAPATRLQSLDVCSGDRVVIGAGVDTCRSHRTPPARILVLDVVAGPRTGCSFPLRTGATTIGRSRHADVSLADPSVSRRHATVTVASDGSVTVTAERGTSNATIVDGTPITGGARFEIAPGACLAVGGTELMLRVVERPEPRWPRDGAVEFQRTPYRPALVETTEVERVGPIPTRPAPRRLQLIAVVAPLIAGIGMFAVVGQAQFLLFTLISPIVMIGTVIDDRRSGRRSHATAVAEFRLMLTRRRAEFERLAEAERVARHRAAPDLAVLARRAEHRTVDLWERGRSAPDFLHLRIGRGDARAAFSVDLERGGDDDLRVEARRALTDTSLLRSVPTIVDLGRHVVAVHGSPELVNGATASLLIQLTTLHSPDDVTVVAAVAPGRDLGWLKWLPHLRSATSPVRGAHLATDRAEADALVASLLEVAAFRTDNRHDTARRWPVVVAVLDATVGADPSAVARLLDLAPAASISVLWLADDIAAIPRHAGLVVQADQGADRRSLGRLWSTDPDVDESEFDLERLAVDVADRVARALAPVRDVSAATRTGSIPRVAPLLDVLGGGSGAISGGIDAAAVAARWTAGRHAPSLPFTIGLDARGPLTLDLVADGPHTLIGGTSGAGKSELLQSMVASLAAANSPERLNFLFVDYKGGASSQVFERLPHTVGCVTNLSGDLALRALTSLRAELDRRMALLEGNAKDLAELLERRPEDAPPSLVIVVDEFATLVKEIPDFVAGVVDIAQRGRSLGIHLVLATQRPTGSVNENILANTNLRISLRMLDRSESTAILGCPDAADIPVPLRGRGLVRLGPGRIVEFQSAFAGAPLVPADRRTEIVTAIFDHPQARPVPSADTSADTGSGPTHLDAVLDAVAEANELLGLAPPRRPWCPVLPDIVPFDQLWADERADVARRDPGRYAVVGLLDAPERQEQYPAVVDLETTGGLLVAGSGGAGATTLLRTLAVGAERAAVAGDAGDAEVATVIIDGGGRGLGNLRRLSSVVDVVAGDDLEAVTRLLLVLGSELDRRRKLLAASGHESCTAALGRVLVLVDAFDVLAGQLLDVGGPLGAVGEVWSDLLRRIAGEGRQVGMHTVITTHRRAAVPARLQSAIGARLVLRHADPQAYGEFGLRPDRAAALESTVGRALLDGATVQLAVVTTDPSAADSVAQSAAIAELAASSERPTSQLVERLTSSALPEHLDPAAVPTAEDPAATVIGQVDVTGAVATVDIEWSHLSVVGPPRSGRSTALAAVIAGLHVDEHVVAVGPRSSPLALLAAVADRAADMAFGAPEVIAGALDRVANLATVAAGDERFVVVVDDLDALAGSDAPVLDAIWSRLLATGRVRLVAAVEPRALTGYTSDPVVTELRRARRMLVLRPDDPNEFLQLTGVRLPARPGVLWPPGRGVLLADRIPTIVQVADLSATAPATVAA